MIGSGLLSIPSDAIGLYANSNDEPLAFRFSDLVDDLYRITIRTDNMIRFSAVSPSTVHYDNYLGAIVSNDRQTVFWTNNSRPLP